MIALLRFLRGWATRKYYRLTFYLLGNFPEGAAYESRLVKATPLSPEWRDETVFYGEFMDIGEFEGLDPIQAFEEFHDDDDQEPLSYGEEPGNNGESERRGW